MHKIFNNGFDVLKDGRILKMYVYLLSPSTYFCHHTTDRNNNDFSVGSSGRIFKTNANDFFRSYCVKKLKLIYCRKFLPI